MRNTIIKIIFLASACFSFLSFSAKSIAVSTDYVTPPATQQSTPLYTLRSYNNIIGVFRYGEDIPIKLVSVFVDSLPVADAEHLKSGIAVYSDQALFDIIEDFNS